MVAGVFPHESAFHRECALQVNKDVNDNLNVVDDHVVLVKQPEGWVGGHLIDVKQQELPIATSKQLAVKELLKQTPGMRLQAEGGLEMRRDIDRDPTMPATELVRQVYSEP